MNKIIEIIKYGSESSTIDFKKVGYPTVKHAKKHEIIKDIIAMANHPSNEDKFIIIGVKDQDLFNIEEQVDDAQYQTISFGGC